MCGCTGQSSAQSKFVRFNTIRGHVRSRQRYPGLTSGGILNTRTIAVKFELRFGIRIFPICPYTRPSPPSYFFFDECVSVLACQSSSLQWHYLMWRDSTLLGKSSSTTTNCNRVRGKCCYHTEQFADSQPYAGWGET